MRALAGVCCAGALFALLGSGTRAQDYTKTMNFTFTDSVQLPGVTLEPGTYMFKLADPESGRRTVQVWDKDGSKMYTMALTTVDRRLNAPDPTKIKDGLVMFGEQPAGTPMAIRTWFYTGDTIGYEFVYPREQAMAIAKAYHTPVLATSDSTSTLSAKVGLIDENGQFTDDATSSVTATASTASTPDQSATASTQSSPSSTTASSTTASTASSTSTASASTTTAPAASVTSTTTTASTTTADDAAPVPAASANRTPPAATVAPSTADTSTTASTTTASTTTASTTTAAAEPAPRAFDSASAQEPRPVGTAGQTTSARATDTTQTANANTLPQTASPLATMAILSSLLMASAVAMRQLRRRYAHSV